MMTNNSGFFVMGKGMDQRGQAAMHEEADAWDRWRSVIYCAAWCIKKLARVCVVPVEFREGKHPSSSFQRPKGGPHKFKIEAVRNRTVPRREVHNEVG